MSGLFTAYRPEPTASGHVSARSPPEQMHWLVGGAAGDFSRSDSGSGPPPSWSTQASVPDFGSSNILPLSASSSQASSSVPSLVAGKPGKGKGSARPPSAPGRFTHTPAPTTVKARPATFPRQSQPSKKAASGASSASKAAAKPASKTKRYLLPGSHVASCADCGSPIAHLQLRGDDEAFAVEWEGVWSCKACLERRGVDDIAQAAEKVKKKRSRCVSRPSHCEARNLQLTYMTRPPAPLAERCATPVASSSAMSASNPAGAAASLPSTARARLSLRSRCVLFATQLAPRLRDH
jgi:hypothetical protein